MTRRLLRAVVAVAVAAVSLGGCAAPADDDGEAVPAGSLVAAPVPGPGASRVVVDTDLGADDLVALALLLRHPAVSVEAITVPGTGLVRCSAGADVVADLLAALGEPAVPVACGRSQRGESGVPFPASWRAAAESGSGLARDAAAVGLPLADEPAAALLGRLAVSGAPLHVVALGPLTNLADLAASAPPAYAALGGVTAMAGVLDGPGQDDVGEWNAAADPGALRAVLEAAHVGGPPLTLVPADAVPHGTPAALAAPVVGSVVAGSPVPAWWDLAAAVAVVAPDAAPAASGSFHLDHAEAGRLRRDGAGPVRLVRSVDLAAIDAVCAEVFAFTPA